jgi:hypothetical protein
MAEHDVHPEPCVTLQLPQKVSAMPPHALLSYSPARHVAYTAACRIVQEKAAAVSMDHGLPFHCALVAALCNFQPILCPIICPRYLSIRLQN